MSNYEDDRRRRRDESPIRRDKREQRDRDVSPGRTRDTKSPTVKSPSSDPKKDAVAAASRRKKVGGLWN